MKKVLDAGKDGPYSKDMDTTHKPYSLRTARNIRHFMTIGELYRELPQGVKVGGPSNIAGDRPVAFPGKKPFAWIERHGR